MPKISVVLDEKTHRDAKVAAMDSQESLSEWVAGLVEHQLVAAKSKAPAKRKPAA